MIATPALAASHAWPARLALLAAKGAGARAVQEILHGAASVVRVACGARVHDVRPLAGALLACASVRGFWGTGWHQFFRRVRAPAAAGHG